MEARGGGDENGDRNGGVRCGRIQTKPADGRMACGRSRRTGGVRAEKQDNRRKRLGRTAAVK